MERIIVETISAATPKQTYRRAASLHLYHPANTEPYIAVLDEVVTEMSDGSFRQESVKTVILSVTDVVNALGADSLHSIESLAEQLYRVALGKEVA